MINRNMRCIEMHITGGEPELEAWINRNMRCIEMMPNLRHWKYISD